MSSDRPHGFGIITGKIEDWAVKSYNGCKVNISCNEQGDNKKVIRVNMLQIDIIACHKESSNVPHIKLLSACPSSEQILTALPYFSKHNQLILYCVS